MSIQSTMAFQQNEKKGNKNFRCTDKNFNNWHHSIIKKLHKMSYGSFVYAIIIDFI